MSSPSSALPEIWIGMLQIRPLFDVTLLGDAAGAYVNVLTWACSHDQFRRKSEELMDALRMEVIAIQNAEPLANRGPDTDYDAELALLIGEVRVNPNAIRYSTFHTWPDKAMIQ